MLLLPVSHVTIDSDDGYESFRFTVADDSDAKKKRGITML